jgi:hypothetical protein
MIITNPEISDTKEKLAAYLNLEIEFLEQVYQEEQVEVYLYEPANTEYIVYNGEIVDKRLSF